MNIRDFIYMFAEEKYYFQVYLDKNLILLHFNWLCINIEPTGII